MTCCCALSGSLLQRLRPVSPQDQGRAHPRRAGIFRTLFHIPTSSLKLSVIYLQCPPETAPRSACISPVLQIPRMSCTWPRSFCLGNLLSRPGALGSLAAWVEGRKRSGRVVEGRGWLRGHFLTTGCEQVQVVITQPELHAQVAKASFIGVPVSEEINGPIHSLLKNLWGGQGSLWVSGSQEQEPEGYVQGLGFGWLIGFCCFVLFFPVLKELSEDEV